jgi:hypothetical protein
MWHELIWSAETYRALIVGFFFLTLSVVAAWRVIPWALERKRKEREKQLIKGLLKEWVEACGMGIVLAMPRDVKDKWLQMKEDGGIAESDSGFRVNDVIGQVWRGIREGSREPKGSAALISEAIFEVMHSNEEKKGGKSLAESDPRYRLTDIFDRERELPTGFISRMLNTIYAKLEIFDLKLMPIKELERAMERLQFFRVKDYIVRSQLMFYTHELAVSMEMFGIYLWKLENWSSKAKAQNGC